jgi:hypothetical protein
MPPHPDDTSTTRTPHPSDHRAQPRDEVRRRRNLVVTVTVTALVVVTGAVLTAIIGGGRGDDRTPSDAVAAELTRLKAVSGLGASSSPPWPVADDAAGRAAQAGLPMGPMGTAEHYHPRLRIVVDGGDVPIPANIGVDPATGAMSALHTHTPDGELHIEAHRADDIYTLGQLFTQWNVRLSKGQLGALGGARRPGTLLTTVDGKPWDGNPALVPLAPEQRIVVRFVSD